MAPSTMLQVDGSASQPSKLLPSKIFTQPGYASASRAESDGVPALDCTWSRPSSPKSIEPNARTNDPIIVVLIFLFVIIFVVPASSWHRRGGRSAVEGSAAGSNCTPSG